MNILIKNATVIAAENKSLHLKKRDILIKNGLIDQIAASIKNEAKTKIIELENLHVSLGWFDSSVSFGEPGYEERETIYNGLETAAKSGFTDIILNANSNPVPDTSSDIVFLKNAAKDSPVNLYPLGALTSKAESKDLAELYDIKNAGAVGFYDYKKPVTNSNLLKIALQYAQNFNALIQSYPLDEKIAGKGIVNEGEQSTKLGLKGLPALAEELQIARDLYVLEYTGGKLHIPTISTAKSVELIAAAKKKALDITCSVAVHNLVLSDRKLKEYDSNYKVMPPLRTDTDIKALQKAVKSGVIDFVTTDHCPINIEEKRVEFDNASYGTIGLESAFGILNKLFGFELTIALLTKGRERFQIENPKLKKGEVVCLTLFRPDIKGTFDKNQIHSTSKNSMFLNSPIKGKVYGIINKNKSLI